VGVISVRSCAEYAHAANFVGLDLYTIVAICGAESGYNTTAHALTSREDSRGLAQINVRAHPWGRSINLYDPRINLQSAWRVYKEAGFKFTPWSTFDDGAYRHYWNAAVIASGGLPAGAPPPPTVVYIRPPTDVPDDYSGHVRNMTGTYHTSVYTLNGWARYVITIPHN
jgi:hypothetical protein